MKTPIWSPENGLATQVNHLFHSNPDLETDPQKHPGSDTNPSVFLQNRSEKLKKMVYWKVAENRYNSSQGMILTKTKKKDPVTASLKR